MTADDIYLGYHGYLGYRGWGILREDVITPTKQKALITDNFELTDAICIDQGLYFRRPRQHCYAVRTVPNLFKI
jgi:hypothetical protein